MIHPNIINESQRGSLRARVSVRWLEAVNTYGNNPKKLFTRININRATNGMALPWCDEGPRSVLNSLNSLDRMEYTNVVDFTGVAQKIGVTTRIIRIELNQFSGSEMTDEVGSNTENRLVIIIFMLR